MRLRAQQAGLAGRRRRAPRRGSHVWLVGRVGALLLAATLCGGCASFEGARLYRSGTRALDSGDAARAVADLERAARLVPQGSEIQNHLGLAYAAAGRPDAARAAFRRAVAIDCDNAAAQRNLEAAERRRSEEPR